MKDTAPHTNEPSLRWACQDAVRASIAKYGWGLLPAEELLERVLHSAPQKVATQSWEPLIVGQYALALYEACRQTTDLERRQRAFNDLYHYLYRAAYNRWPEQAAEVAQRALVLTYEKLADCNNPAAILTYALWQARRAFTEIRRRSEKELSLDQIAASGLDLVLPIEEMPIFDQDCLRLVLDALRHMPERQRQVIVLKYLDHLSDETISQRVGLTVANVRVLRNRGLKRLRADPRLREICVELANE